METQIIHLLLTDLVSEDFSREESTFSGFSESTSSGFWLSFCSLKQDYSILTDLDMAPLMMESVLAVSSSASCGLAYTFTLMVDLIGRSWS